MADDEAIASSRRPRRPRAVRGEAGAARSAGKPTAARAAASPTGAAARRRPALASAGRDGEPRAARRDDKRGTSPTRRPQQGPHPQHGGQWRRDELPAHERTAVQAEYDGPPIPDDITGNELDRVVTNQLKSLPEKLAARVARHLVAAARLIDTDPETAYQHTLAARARAARVAIVREACGEAAYAAGHSRKR